MTAEYGFLATFSVMIGSLLLIVGVFFLFSYMQRRLEMSVRLHRATTSAGEQVRRGGALAQLRHSLDYTLWGKRIRRQLDRADLDMTPAEYLGALVLATALIFLVIRVLFGTCLAVNVTAAVAGAYLANRAYLASRRDHYIAAFDAQMSEVALLLSNSLRAGLSVPQAFEVVAEKLERPAGPEFARTSHEMRLGLSMEESLRQMVERLPSGELRLMITTILIQRVAGGNLAHALSVMSTAIVARYKLKDEVRTMTSEVRFNAIILLLLPIAIMALINLMTEGAVGKFLSNPIGLVIGVIFAGIMTLTFYLINKVGAIEV